MGSSSSLMGPYAPKISRRWFSLTFFVSFSTMIWDDQLPDPCVTRGSPSIPLSFWEPEIPCLSYEYSSALCNSVQIHLRFCSSMLLSMGFDCDPCHPCSHYADLHAQMWHGLVFLTLSLSEVRLIGELESGLWRECGLSRRRRSGRGSAFDPSPGMVSKAWEGCRSRGFGVGKRQ